MHMHLSLGWRLRYFQNSDLAGPVIEPSQNLILALPLEMELKLAVRLPSWHLQLLADRLLPQ
jgi:hypothetical protein